MRNPTPESITRRAWLGGLAATAADAAPRRPNLVFLFSDQHAYDMMGCSGNRDVQTPAMDRLSAEGIHFDHCFSTTPVCSPYRAMLLSGLHPLACGPFFNDVTLIPGKGKYFGEALRDAGYRTGYFGKWHVLGGNRVRPVPRGELRYGFDGPFLTNNCTTVFDAARAYYWNERGERTLYGDWEPYAQSRQACAFLDEQRPGRPFALFLSWHPPHDHGRRQQYFRYDTLPELMRLYEGSSPALRPSVAQIDGSELRRQQYRDYMAQTTGIDRALAMVLDRLKRKNLESDTIVVYTTDHGDTLGSYGWQSSAKNIPHDCATRVPFLLRYPGVLQPRRSHLLLGPLDLMPTLLGLMGIAPPASCQGRNLADAIRRGDDRATDSVPLANFRNGPDEYRGVVTREWTFAAQRFDAEPHPLINVLHHRGEDPHQMRNQFAANARVRRQMMELTRSWMERFSDPFVTHRELMASGIPWQYPDAGGAVNRISPLEWASGRKAATARFHGE